LFYLVTYTSANYVPVAKTYCSRGVGAKCFSRCLLLCFHAWIVPFI